MELYGIYINLDIFILILLRISGYIFTSPLIGRKEIPSTVKICISIIFTYILIISGVPSADSIPEGTGTYILFCFNETLTGMCIGFMSTIFFSIFTTAGRLMDVNIGFHMGEVLDPRYRSAGSLSGNFLNVAAFIVFLILNGHLQMIEILTDSYSSAHIGQAVYTIRLADIFISAFSLSFLLAVKLALPVIIITLITEAVMGIMVKFIPQMNVFVIGIPLKILLGVLSLVFIITPFVNLLDSIFDSVYSFASHLYM